VTKEKYLNWVRHPIRKGKGNKKQIWPVMSLVTVGIAVYFYVAGQTVYELFFLALTFLSVSWALLLSQILAAKEFKKLVRITAHRSGNGSSGFQRTKYI
jgi:hypothetical protein